MQINEIREEVKVTIVCITYNHEMVIRDALDSFLRQKTNFDYQIFVGEDSGPDNTADIVQDYARKYPDKIVAFLREKNLGAQHNLIDLCERAKSPYIALCEGDDYWIDDYKLQKQYDFMESHPDMRLCFARAEISAPENWFLGNYFKKNKQGKLIYPESDPLCPKTNANKPSVFTNQNFIGMNIAHTSTVFYRYNYNIQIPDWYYQGLVGDHSLILMQLGDGKCAMLPDIVSVYRRSDVGVYMSDNMDEHFMKTRLDWVRIMKGMISFYEENEIENFPRQLLIERVRKEITNYLRSAINAYQLDKINELIKLYPEECEDIFQLYTDYYFVNRRMTALYSWEGKMMLTTNGYYMHLISPFIKLSVIANKIYKKAKYGIKNFIVYLMRFCGYWFYSIIPKKKTVWVFSGFKKQTYMDNIKYLFEYINYHHPEIETVWVTKSDDVMKEIKEKKLPVLKMNSLKGIWKTARAAIAVTDHFIMSDYSQIYGINHRTKVVQLWHGVGFKSMGDGINVANTNVNGVQYSTDILVQPEDSIPACLFKKIKYFFLAPARELFEKYFIFVCPGQERIDMIGKKWNMNEECFFMAGHPRNIQVYKKLGLIEKKNKILYAPTYRFQKQKEKEMIYSCINAFGIIQEFMEKIDGQFILRLHPHTWRNYDSAILSAIQTHDRIQLDKSEDFYDTILEYSYVISDYSSIALDCSLFGIPAVFLCEDYDWFVKHEAGFGVDFLNMTPGPKAYSWEDALHEINNYIENPTYMLKERQKILNYYFDEDANSKNDSENIVNEIKKRLGI